MPTVEQWLQRYGESHQNPVNKAIHWVCVPLIMWSILAFLWSFPVPATISHPALNWATVVSIAVLAYYLTVSLSLATGMALVLTALCLATWWLDTLTVPLRMIAVVVFILTWIGQFIGHKLEGKKPSFMEDLQFLLIGPLWLLHFLYRRLGIPIRRANP